MLSCGPVSEDLYLTIGTEPERSVEHLEQNSEPVRLFGLQGVQR